MILRGKTIHILIILLLSVECSGQAVLWERSLGGTGSEIARSVISDDDTLYMAGYSSSSDNGFENMGKGDILVVKLASDGRVIWTRNFGGSGMDDPYRILQTGDGNLLILGNTGSKDGDLAGNKGEKDGFVIKIDRNGNLLWANQLGGTKGDYFMAGAETGNGDVFLAGITESSDNNLSGHGLIDGWVAKITVTGELIWQKSYGGTFNDLFMDLAVVNDTLLVACGRTRSNDQDVAGYNGTPGNSSDAGWVVLMDTAGIIQDQYCIGANDSINVSLNTVMVTKDEKIITGGEISENTNTVSHSNFRPFMAIFSELLEPEESLHREWTGNYGISQIEEGGNNDIYLIGTRNRGGEYYFDPDGFMELYIIRVNEDLEVEWEYNHGIEGAAYLGTSAAIDSGGNIYACGGRGVSQDGRVNNLDTYLIRLCSAVVSISEVVLCQGDSIEINGKYISESGIYYDFPGSGNNCDSLVAYSVNIAPSYYFRNEYRQLCNVDIVLHDSLISHSGDYIFEFRTEFNCDSIYDYSVEIHNTDNRVKIEGGTITSLQPDADYQWYNCLTDQPVEGATGQSYTVTESGEYKVEINYHGCLDESECFFVAGPSYTEDEVTGLKVFPNPTGSRLQISSNTLEIRLIQITDLMGSVQAEFECYGNSVEVDISCFPGGMYLLRVITDKTILSRNIVKD